MRFKLILEVNNRAFGNILPINYQYEASSAIYKILSAASEEYADWLHENGFTIEGKRFKLFTFSRFKIEKRKILPDVGRIAILCNDVEWQITFLPEKSTEKFIQGLFTNQTFEIGDKKSVVQFKIRGVEMLPPPEYSEEMEFSSMSPMCLRDRHEDGKTEYLMPTDKKAKQAILTGLLSRYESYYGKSFDEPFDFDFQPLSEPKSVLVTLKTETPDQTKVRGFMCKFKMKAPKELMKIMYESGIGEECAQGFGCVWVKEKPSITKD
jgi:CRISPR-associated endoribonuclease Cas6